MNSMYQQSMEYLDALVTASNAMKRYKNKAMAVDIVIEDGNEIIVLKNIQSGETKQLASLVLLNVYDDVDVDEKVEHLRGQMLSSFRWNMPITGYVNDRQY